MIVEIIGILSAAVFLKGKSVKNAVRFLGTAHQKDTGSPALGIVGNGPATDENKPKHPSEPGVIVSAFFSPVGSDGQPVTISPVSKIGSGVKHWFLN